MGTAQWDFFVFFSCFILFFFPYPEYSCLPGKLRRPNFCGVCWKQAFLCLMCIGGIVQEQFIHRLSLQCFQGQFHPQLSTVVSASCTKAYLTCALSLLCSQILHSWTEKNCLLFETVPFLLCKFLIFSYNPIPLLHVKQESDHRAKMSVCEIEIECRLGQLGSIVFQTANYMETKKYSACMFW